MEAERPAPYRVTILPTVLEVSARLATREELRGLVKLLRASAVIWGKTETKEDCERPSYEVPEEDLLTLRDIWRRLQLNGSETSSCRYWAGESEVSAFRRERRLA